MKSLFLAIAAVFLLTATSMAQDKESISVRVGQQKAAMKGKVTIKLLSLGDDSRCPVGATCVWAGNANVKVQISISAGSSKTLELNTNLEPKSAILGGFWISLISLTPRPGEKSKALASPHLATFAIERVNR